MEGSCMPERGCDMHMLDEYTQCDWHATLNLP